jgi:UMF1 family MFS transporter
MPADTKRASATAIGAWVLYDWSYGAYTTIVSTFVFATYFTQGVAPDPATGASWWAGGQALAGVLIALLSVPLGAIADQGGRRRSMLGGCTAIMVVCTLALWFVRPNPSYAALALALVVVGTIAFEVASVFYNAMLPDLVPPARIGRLSMLGWGAGYAGGLVALGLCLVVLISPATPPFGLDRAAAEPVRATALLAGTWLALFGWPVSVFVPEAGRRAAWGVALRRGLGELRAVLRDLRHERTLSRFLLARLFYIDGLNTLFAFGGIYAAGEFGLDAQQVLIFGIVLNVSSGVGALGFAFADHRLGAKATILISVLALTGLSITLLLIHGLAMFWVLGTVLGLFVGPAQAASRSMMAQMAPPDARAAWFGLFALSGRVTAFFGPLVLGVLTAIWHSQRVGMAVIPVFLLLGAMLLINVPSPAADAGAAGE